MCPVDVQYIICEINNRAFVTDLTPIPHLRPYLSWSPRRSSASYHRMRTHPRREPTSCGPTSKRKTTVRRKKNNNNNNNTHATHANTFCPSGEWKVTVFLTVCTYVREREREREKISVSSFYLSSAAVLTSCAVDYISRGINPPGAHSPQLQHHLCHASFIKHAASTGHWNLKWLHSHATDTHPHMR